MSSGVCASTGRVVEGCRGRGRKLCSISDESSWGENPLAGRSREIRVRDRTSALKPNPLVAAASARADHLRPFFAHSGLRLPIALCCYSLSLSLTLCALPRRREPREFIPREKLKLLPGRAHIFPWRVLIN